MESPISNYSIIDTITSLIENHLGKLPQSIVRARIDTADYSLNINPLRREQETIEEAVERLRGVITPLLPKGITISGEKGYINFHIDNEVLVQYSRNIIAKPNGGIEPANQRTMVEFFSPNTNKPMHLGHLRNIALGESLTRILKFMGHDVLKVNLYNDRGGHICKSMLAYQMHGNGQTPESTGIKGDHFVGNFYVAYEKAMQAELKPIIETMRNTPEAQQEISAITRQIEEIEADKKANIDDKKLKTALEKAKKTLEMIEDRIINKAKMQCQLIVKINEMLQKWEDGDTEVLTLWKKMNGWAISGMEQTLKRLNTSFDVIYFESNTYKRAMDMINTGLKKGIFEKDITGAVTADLDRLGVTDREGKPLHGKKILLRSDGTSVYITQDLAMAELKAKDYYPNNSIYVVADEQIRHFEVLFGLLKALGYEWANHLRHLSYGMVDLPHGRMKSREGTVVDADDILDELRDKVKISNIDITSADKIGIAAMRYYLLSNRPESKIKFDPEQSVKLEGKTGPYILYQYVRSGKIIQNYEKNIKAQGLENMDEKPNFTLLSESAEHQLLMTLVDFTEHMKTIQRTLDQTILSDYVYKLAKAFSIFYENCPILKKEAEGMEPMNSGLKRARFELVQYTHNLLSISLELLGIEAVEQM